MSSRTFNDPPVFQEPHTPRIVCSLVSVALFNSPYSLCSDDSETVSSTASTSPVPLVSVASASTPSTPTATRSSRGGDDGGLLGALPAFSFASCLTQFVWFSSICDIWMKGQSVNW
jgi:hypothetical protein